MEYGSANSVLSSWYNFFMIANPESKIDNKSPEYVEQEIFKKFLKIQLVFADKARELNEISKEDALIEYSSIYRNTLKLPWPISKNNPVWREFIDKCLLSNDFAQSAWEFIQKHKGEEKKESQKKKFGPFSYKYDQTKNSIILHFSSEDRSVDPEKSSELRANLKMMLNNIKTNYPEAIFFEGISWILKFIARVLPKEFTANTIIENGWFKSEAIWGQFKTSSGIRERSIKEFLEKVEKAKSTEDLQNAFPYQILSAKCEIKHFYELYRIE